MSVHDESNGPGSFAAGGAPLPSFHDSFDPGGGRDFQASRAYWLGCCSELVYPASAEEKAADRKAREARSAERALRPPLWKRWRRGARTTEFERARSEARAAVRRVARTEAARIERQVTAWGFDRFRFFSGISTQCFVAAGDRSIVVCFRGTEANRPWDIYDDLVAIPTRVWQVKGLVHLMFWTGLKQVWRDVDAPPLVWPSADGGAAKGFRDCLAEFRNRDRPQPVWLTGHSLGGALATLAAARLVGERILRPEEVGGVYTFGQPRVGDRDFEAAYELADRHFRLVHDNDLVTRMPPRSLRRLEAAAGMFGAADPGSASTEAGGWRFQYRHVGRVAFLDRAGRLEPDIQSWKMLLLRTVSRLGALFRSGSLLDRFLPGLPDHGIAGYNRAIATYLTTGAPDSWLQRLATTLRGPLDSAGALVAGWTGGRRGRSDLLAVAAGSAVGLLGGLLAGMFMSPIVELVVGGLASLLALLLGVGDRHFKRSHAILVGTLGFACAAGALIGISARTHDLGTPAREELVVVSSDRLTPSRATP